MVGKKGPGASEWRSLLQVTPSLILADASSRLMRLRFKTMCENYLQRSCQFCKRSVVEDRIINSRF